MAIGVRMSAGDARAVKLLLALGVMFSMMAALAYCIHNMKHVQPLPMDAPLDRFSEARAVEHVRHLSKEIRGRQEGSPGLSQAAHYIKARLESIAARAMPNYSIEIDESVVDGSFSMNFLGHTITFGYRNHTNIAMRIASEYSKDTDPSVLVNAHFDGPLGSPGAGDCASCVASLLELGRLIVDSSWIPPQPVIFLFNGAEELFLLVFYSGRMVVVLHSLPIIMFLSMPFFLCRGVPRVEGFFSVFCQLFKGMLLHVFGILLAVIVPVTFAICRLLFSGYAMSWFAHPWLAFLMFIPSSLIGLLIPRIIWSDPSSRGVASKSSTMGISNETRFWGAFGYYSSLTLAYQAFGLHGGFLTLMISVFMFTGWIANRLSIRSFGQNSLRSVAGFVVALIPLLLYSVYFGGFLVQFLIEKMGMMGSLPPPYDVNRVEESSYNFAVVDSNSLSFLFKYSPEAANVLEIGSQMNSLPSNQDELVALFPVSYLLSGGLKFYTKEDDILKHYTYLPYLFSNKPTEHYSPVSRRIYLEFYLGSLEEVWVSVLNITGPLSGWSFADNTVPDPERINGGPPSYICRLSGRGDQNWTFWLEANSSESLRIDVAVVDQYLAEATRKLKGAFPDWLDVVAYSSYVSSYFF